MKEKLIGWKQEEKLEASVKRTSTNFFSKKFLQYIKTPLKDKVKKNISHSILIRLHQPRINISSTYRDYISKIIATTNFLL